MHSGRNSWLLSVPKAKYVTGTDTSTIANECQLFISDLNNVGSPFRMGNAVARADDFECLDWNKRTAHIMVTGSSGGTMTVWDIKNKRESLTLNNLGRKPVSAVAWDPVKVNAVLKRVRDYTDEFADYSPHHCYPK